MLQGRIQEFLKGGGGQRNEMKCKKKKKPGGSGPSLISENYSH